MYFVILTTQRSGSHMLSSALNSHPDIHCVGETNNTDPLNETYGEIKHYNQIKDLKKYDKIIHLVRNPLDVAKSRLGGRKLIEMGYEHKPHTFTKDDLIEVEIPRKEAKHLASVIEQKVNDMRDKIKDLDHKEVSYDNVNWNAICDFLNVSRKTLKPTYQKLNRKYILK